MDETNSEGYSRSSTLDFIYDNLVVNNSSLITTTCAMCQRSISSDNETGSLESIALCGDCKFLLLEGLQTSSPNVYSRRTPGSRGIGYGSSEYIESIFSQQFSQMISMAGQTQPTVLDHDYQSMGGDGAVRLLQQTSARTTPNVSRRWRRVFSDTESDGFDSVYGETESNVSFRRYRLFHGDTDTVLYSAYGGDSDADVDAHSILGNDNFALSNGSDEDSDTDIDPMNAGIYHWNSDDQEDEEGDSEWEEADIEQNPVQSSNNGNNWRRQFLSLDVDDTFMLRIQERIQAHTTDLLTNFEESEREFFVGDSGDHLDARGFDNLLEHLAETENSRRGAPPASETCVKNLALLSIKEDHDKLESLACAICKESITVATVVNQLPCFHLYHPNCILPWLSARNTCPICRYELPTDDKDYEERKRSSGSRVQTLVMHRRNVEHDRSVSFTNEAAVNEPSRVHYDREEREVVNADSARENDARENRRNRWFFLAAAAAAPIVSVVGISLMLWFGKPPSDRRWPSNRITYCRESGQRRWRSFF